MFEVKNTQEHAKNMFFGDLKVDHIGLVSKDIIDLIKVLSFWFGI